MGYSLRVAAAALALATVPLARAQDARQFSSVEVAMPAPRYDPEIPDRKIHLLMPREAPAVEQPKTPVKELTAEERFAMGMRTLQVEWDAAWFPTPQQPNPVYRAADQDLHVPYAGYAASLNEFLYTPFEDGTFDPEDPLYKHDLGRTKDWARHRIVNPVREQWKGVTHQQYDHDDTFGLVTRQSFEPYFSGGAGLQWAKVWEDTNGHRQRSRIRIQDLQDWQMGYFHERNTWRFAATVGRNDGETEIRVGVRVRIGENSSLERIAKRHRHGRSDSVHEVRAVVVEQSVVTPMDTPPQRVGIIARSTLGR